MEIPKIIECIKDEWTLVGSGILTALLHKQSNLPHSYSWTYRPLGGDPPTELIEGIKAFVNNQTEPLFFQKAADIYIYALRNNGFVRLDSGVNVTSSGIPDWTEVKFPSGLDGSSKVIHNLGRFAEIIGDATLDDETQGDNSLVLPYAHANNHFIVSATGQEQPFTIRYR